MEKINKDHPLSKSEDILQNNIDSLKKLFPTIVKEGKIDMKELEALLSDEVEKGDEYYRFTWAGKSEARREANKPSTGTLRPDKESSKNWDTTQNIFIEGDNLEVLKLLQKSYAGKIKMIYIDPPYNTGKDFVYKDNYADNLGNYLELTGQTDEEGKRLSTNTESDGRYHSNWLNMMYPRLKLARTLLKEDGVIFISIDDNEITNLRKICDEIFGEDSFIANLIWKSGRTASSHFTNEHEYIVCYAKNKSALPLFKFNGESNISDRAIKRESDKNPTSVIHFPKGMDFECEDKIFPSEFGDMEKIKIINGTFQCKDGKLESDVDIEAAWTMKDMIESWIDGDVVTDQKGQIVKRFFFKSNGVLQYEKQKGTIHPKSIIVDYSTKNGTSTIKKLLGKPYFEFPKPPGLIAFLSGVVMDKSDILLDFFAGSGTTAHATYLLNQADCGNRKFISVQLPEPVDEKSEAGKANYKFISDLTKERIRRAGEIIEEELIAKIRKQEKKAPELDLDGKPEQIFAAKHILNNIDLGFKVYKLDTSNIVTWDGNPENLEQTLLNSNSNIKIDRSEDDVLYEVLLKYGLDLTVPIEERVISNCKVYSVGNGVLFVCLADNIYSQVAEGIGKWKEVLNPVSCRVLFKDAGFPDDAAKTNSTQILKRFGITEINSL